MRLLEQHNATFNTGQSIHDVNPTPWEYIWFWSETPFIVQSRSTFDVITGSY
jgi:hypothetical protein